MGAAIAVFLMGLSLAGAPAGAQSNDDYADVLTSGTDRPTVGASCNNTDITVTTANLAPGTDATFTLYSDPVVLGTITADANGNATIVFDLPAGTTLGRHEVVTTGTDENGVAGEATTVLNVTTCAPGPGGGNNNNGDGSLARTGTDVDTPIRAAVVVFAAGAALLLISRKRQALSA